MSEAAFTDSTTLISCLALTTAPWVGSSMNTMSPSSSWAWSEMPTVTVPSSSTRTHSWVAAYFKSSGKLLTHRSSFCGYIYDYGWLFEYFLAEAHEIRFDQAHRHQLSTEFDAAVTATHRDSSQGDGMLQ